MECIKFTEKSWAFRLADTEQPLVVDTNGKKNYVPTVFALWKEPRLCPTLYIASNTSAFVIKGADLMLPGVLVPPSGLDFKKGQAVSITVVGNPYPIGAGITNMDSATAKRFVDVVVAVVVKWMIRFLFVDAIRCLLLLQLLLLLTFVRLLATVAKT